MSRLPSFRSIEKFYVQSKHGLKIDSVTLKFGDEVEIKNLQPCTVRRLYNSCLIGSRDQVERHGQKIGLSILGKFERHEGGEGKSVKEIQNAPTGQISPEFKKAKK